MRRGGEEGTSCNGKWRWKQFWSLSYKQKNLQYFYNQNIQCFDNHLNFILLMGKWRLRMVRNFAQSPWAGKRWRPDLNPGLLAWEWKLLPLGSTGQDSWPWDLSTPSFPRCGHPGDLAGRKRLGFQPSAACPEPAWTCRKPPPSWDGEGGRKSRLLFIFFPPEIRPYTVFAVYHFNLNIFICLF